MGLWDVLGHLGNIGFLLGAIYIARNKRVGFYWQIEGNVFYLLQSMLLHITSLFILSFILILVNVYGLYNWSKIKKESN
jgi:hypothetical protein